MSVVKVRVVSTTEYFSIPLSRTCLRVQRHSEPMQSSVATQNHRCSVMTKMAEGHVQPRPCGTVGAASGTGTATGTGVCASTPVCPVTLNPPVLHIHISFICFRRCVVAAFGSLLKFCPLIFCLCLSPCLWKWTSNISWYLRNDLVLWNPLVNHVQFLTVCVTKLVWSVLAHLLCHFPPRLRVKPHSLVTYLWPETA